MEIWDCYKGEIVQIARWSDRLIDYEARGSYYKSTDLMSFKIQASY